MPDSKIGRELHSDLRVSRRHVISTLHDAPDLPADGRVAERHDGQRQGEDQDEHVKLVGPPQEPGFGITHAPVGDKSQPDLLMRLKEREEKGGEREI